MSLSPRVETSGAFGAEITVENLDEVRDALERVEPALRRALDRDLREAVRTVAGAAARKVHSRSGATAAGYKVSRRAGGWRIANRTRGAAILEFAAVPHSVQGAHLIATLEEQYGSPGRILWDSWDALAPWVEDRVRDLVDDACAELETVVS